MKHTAKIVTMMRVLALAVPAALWADVKLASPFQEHMVLQQGKSLPVWGWADPGEKVTVSHRGKQASTVATAEGKWRVDLPEMKAAAEPADFTVQGKNTITLRDVLVGEVWLCSGQSNMAFTVARGKDAEKEIAAAKYPLIRHYQVTRTRSPKPMETVEGSWTVCSPETVGGYTAVGYFFARELYQKLGVPIGLVHSSWGGTPAEAWVREAELRAEPMSKAVYERTEKTLAAYPAAKARHEEAVAKWKAERDAAKAAKKSFKKAAPKSPAGPESPRIPSVLYNGMIRPLVPYAIRGAIWYQGEGNASFPEEYRALMSTLITQWRKEWGIGDFPFYQVQLANFRHDGEMLTNYAFIREAQSQVVAQLPNCGHAVAIDIGEVKDIHPKNKQDVGHRLAAIARAKVYGEKIEWSGPAFEKAERKGAAMRVVFSHAAGLEARGGAATGFELAGADGKFVAATAAIQTDGSVLVTAPTVQEPVAVRYAFRNAPEANLYNSAGLPAVPFRTDNWPRVK